MIRALFSFSPRQRRHFSLASVALFCALLLPAAGFAQEQDPDEVLRVETNLVQLNVGVVDRQGRPILNLSRNDFVVYENDVRQTIQSFEPTTTPFSLVLMLDMSGSTLGFRQTLKISAMRFIDALAPEDRVAIITFNEKAELLQNFTSDRRKIAERIDLAQGQGKTHFYNALQFAMRQLATEGKRRKAIIVLTDGLDTGMRQADREAASSATTNEAAIASIKPGQSAPLNSVLSVADRMGVTIYPLALPSGDAKLLPFPDPQQIAMYTAARARLQALADRTGGRLNEIRRLEDMGKLYALVAAELRTLYSLTYQPSGERKRDGSWRAIRIEVTRPEMIARSKSGYYSR
ncbi:MAG TPA: VWA domain-containing protein [Pyrinomonadaceae bacterium]|jgi:Ca-activated chloride channel family protein